MAVRTQTWAVRSLLVLAIFSPVGLLVVDTPHAPPAWQEHAITSEAIRARQEAVSAELRGLVERGGRFTLLKITDPSSKRFVSFSQDRGQYLLVMYVPRRHLDEAALARLVGALSGTGAGPASEAGDFMLTYVFDPDRAAEAAVRVFGEVYQIGPEVALKFSGDR